MANKDDDNIVKVTSGVTAVFATGNNMDDPRGVEVGPAYSGGGGASGQGSVPADNDGPEIDLAYSAGAAVAAAGTVLINASGPSPVSLAVTAHDPEGDAVSISALAEGLPAGYLSVSDHGNGTASLRLGGNAAAVPVAGLYALLVEASDGDNVEREPYLLIVR